MNQIPKGMDRTKPNITGFTNPVQTEFGPLKPQIWSGRILCSLTLITKKRHGSLAIVTAIEKKCHHDCEEMEENVVDLVQVLLLTATT